MDIDLRPPSQEPSPDTRRHGGGRLFLMVSLVLVLLAVLAGGAYFYFTPSTDEEKIQDVVAEVGEIMLLPEGETPTLATVIDLERLAGQPFFKNAKKGDVVLIYTKAQKAILYDPVAHKIIEAALLAIDKSSL